MLEPCTGTKKAGEHEGDGDTILARSGGTW